MGRKDTVRGPNRGDGRPARSAAAVHVAAAATSSGESRGLRRGGRPKASARQAVAFWRDLPLLQDPDGVAERVADAHVGAVEVVGGLLGEVGDAARLERLVQAAGIVGDEDEAAQGALGDELAELRGGRLVVQRRARLLQRDLGLRLAGNADRQPAVVTLPDVVALLEPELVDVEVERLLLVEDVDRGDVEPVDHLVILLCASRCG